MMYQVPSVGRIVHYVSYGTPGGEFPSVCRAAIVTAVPIDQYISELKEGYLIDLCVINPEGLFFNKGVRYSKEFKGGTWHWPERV